MPRFSSCTTKIKQVHSITSTALCYTCKMYLNPLTPIPQRKLAQLSKYILQIFLYKKEIHLVSVQEQRIFNI